MLATASLSLNSGPIAAARETTVLQNEKALQEHLTQTLTPNARPPEAKWWLASELHVGSVIPDLVLGCTLPNCLEQNWPNRWTYFHCHVISALRRRSPLTKSTLSRRIGIRMGPLQRVLDDLIKAQTIMETHTGSFKISPTIADTIPYVMGIELKIARWVDAIEQAKKYLTFCQAASVILTRISYQRLLEVSTTAKYEGIGLYLAESTGLRELVKPRQFAAPLTPEREYVAASLLTRPKLYWSPL